MKTKYLKKSTTLITVLSFLSLSTACMGTIEPYAREAGKINKAACIELKQVYGIDSPGLGFQVTQDPNILNVLYIRLMIDGFIDVNQARHLTLNVIDTYMKHIQANQEFIHKCVVDSFDESHLNIIIVEPYKPASEESFLLSSVSVSHGKICYVYRKKIGKLTHSRDVEESIAEARQKVVDEVRGIERCQN